MKVERVFTRKVVYINRSSSLQAAAAMMRDNHVGILLVSGDPPLERQGVGVITDRDMVVQAVARGLDLRDMCVADVMTPMIGTVAEKADLHEALETMRAAGVRRLAVSDHDHRLVGMLSIDDVVDGLAADLGSLAALMKSEVARERDLAGEPA
jgi:CBS domain-containing protein